MKIQLSFIRSLIFLILSQGTIPSAAAQVIPEKTKKLLEYSLSDQHDSLMITLQDNLTDININRAMRTSHLEHFERMTLLAQSGAIPLKSYLALKLQVKLDELNDKALNYRYEATLEKIRSLEGLKSGNLSEFAERDRNTNLSQWKSFQAELEKAKETFNYTQERHDNVHPVAKSGSIAWAEDHELELELEKNRQTLDGWVRKCAEQEKQYLAAEDELKNLKK
jgi:hypothetical protein